MEMVTAGVACVDIRAVFLFPIRITVWLVKQRSTFDVLITFNLCRWNAFNAKPQYKRLSLRIGNSDDCLNMSQFSSSVLLPITRVPHDLDMTSASYTDRAGVMVQHDPEVGFHSG